MKRLTDKDFAGYIKDGDKIVVCTANYCGACTQTLKQIECEFGHVILTDPRARATMIKLKCKKVPTAIWYRDGKEVRRAEGTAALFDLTKQARRECR